MDGKNFEREVKLTIFWGIRAVPRYRRRAGSRPSISPGESPACARRRVSASASISDQKGILCDGLR